MLSRLNHSKEALFAFSQGITLLEGRYGGLEEQTVLLKLWLNKAIVNLGTGNIQDSQACFKKSLTILQTAPM